MICGGERVQNSRYVFSMNLNEESEFVIPSSANG